MATGGGGYAVVDVVPRAWAHLVGVARRAAGCDVHGGRRSPGAGRGASVDRDGRRTGAGGSVLGPGVTGGLLDPAGLDPPCLRDVPQLSVIWPQRRRLAGEASHPRSGWSRHDAQESGAARASAEVRFLTVAEVASIMRVSKMTVYRLVHGGRAAGRAGRAVLPGAGAGRRRLPARLLRRGRLRPAATAGRRRPVRYDVVHGTGVVPSDPDRTDRSKEVSVGSVIKKRRKRMAKKKHRKLLKKTRVQRRNKK